MDGAVLCYHLNSETRPDPASDNEANCNDLNGTDNLGETAKGLHFSLDLENAGDCGADWLSTDFTQLMDPTDLDFWNVDINLPDC